MRKLLSVAMLALTASALFAADAVEKRVPVLKVGTCSITLLGADGIQPLAGATLKLNNAQDGKAVLSSTANKAGLCVLDISEGRYVLNVNEKPVTLINASAEGGLVWARIVISDKPMLIGGQDPAEEGKVFSFLGLQGGPGVGAALLTGAAAVGGGWLIYDNNEGSGGNDNDNNGSKPTPDDNDRPRYDPPSASL